MTGRIFAVVGASGVGKDTLMRAVQDRGADVVLARRVITRPGDAGGEDFDAVTEATFLDRLNRGAFALHWTAHGLHYAIPASVHDALDRGQTVLFNGSRAALPQAAQVFDDLHVLHITASDTALAARLTARGRETPAQIERRLDRARIPLPDGLNLTTIDNSGPTDHARDQILALLSPASALG